MYKKSSSECTLIIPLERQFLLTATSFVKHASESLGLGTKEALSLQLAIEEIFCYFYNTAQTSQTMEIRCTSGGYYVQIECIISIESVNLRALNLTTRFSLEMSDDFDELGLFLVSRSVDRFCIKWDKPNRLHLMAIKEKSYPSIDEYPPIAATMIETYTVRSPEREEMKLFVRLAQRDYPAICIPSFFSFPGKVADMITGKEYRALLAVGESGQIAGGILMHLTGEKTVEFYGPYCFDTAQKDRISRSLLEICIESIAKTKAVALINQIPEPAKYCQYMEPLGEIYRNRETGDRISLPTYFRQIHEDMGSAVWIHSALNDFVSAEYRRLSLPREIRTITDVEESLSLFSVLSTEIDRKLNRAIIHPLLPGRDIEENIRNHIILFMNENILDVFFHMDLGQSWHARFAPDLLNLDFKPRMVLPYYGEGDVLLFQLEAPMQ